MDEVPIRAEGTVLFCDIRGFTMLFDQSDPLEAFQFANTVLARLAAVVFDLGGALDKFTGDGLLAHFGIARSAASHAMDAVNCAIRMRGTLGEINRTRYFARQPVISLGVGLCSGKVAYGPIALGDRRETTVLGDVVNTASRIEGLTKRYVVDVLLSEETHALIAGRFRTRVFSQVEIRGKTGRHDLHWLLPTNQEVS